MNFNKPYRKKTTPHRFLSAFVSLIFFFNIIVPPAYAQGLNLPPVGTMVNPSPAFVPVMLKGMTIYTDNPLRFDFIVDSGNTKFTPDQIKEESNRLVKYFLAAMTVPQNDLWVNLSPYEANKTIPSELGKTDLGRDMLAQDYILKQLSASLLNPDKELGKDFWDRVYKKAQEKFGTTAIPLNTFNKVWIMPEEATVYENGNAVYIVKSRLKVMLDEDYVTLQNNRNNEKLGTNRLSVTEVEASSAISSQIVREIILPEIEREVNEGKNFAPIRQIYQSLILAKWYKETIKESLLSKVYIDQKKIMGVDLSDPTVKDQIYAQYVEAFKKGVFNLIKEDYDPTKQKAVPRKYFSGGEKFGEIPLKRTKDSSQVNSSPVGKQYGLAILINPWSRLMISRARKVLDNLDQHLDYETELIIKAIKRIGGSSEKDPSDIERLKSMLRQRPYISEVAETQLTYGQKIGAYLDLLAGKEFRIHEKAVERLGVLAKKGDQAVIDALLREIYIKGAIQALGKIAYKGDEKVVTALIARIKLERNNPRGGEAADVLVNLTERGDQRVIEALLPSIDDWRYGVDYFLGLGATKEQCYLAALKSKPIYLLRRIVLEGELIEPDDRARESKINRARDASIDAYVAEVARPIFLSSIRETIPKFVAIAGKGNQRAINGLISALPHAGNWRGHVVEALGEITGPGDMAVLDRLYVLIRSEFAAKNYELVKQAIAAINKIDAEAKKPADILSIIDKISLESSLLHRWSNLSPYYDLDTWIDLGPEGREIRIKVLDLVEAKLMESYPKYFGPEGTRDDPFFELTYADIDKAIDVYKEYDDFDVIYHKSILRLGASVTDGITTLPGPVLFSQKASVEIVEPSQKTKQALEELATDSESQYQLGLKLERSDPAGAIKMFAKSGLKDAIEPLKRLLSYDLGDGSDHYFEYISVAEDASRVLENMAGTDSELQYQVGLEGLKSPWTSIKIWAIKMLAKSGRKEAREPLKGMLSFSPGYGISEAAREALEELGVDGAMGRWQYEKVTVGTDDKLILHNATRIPRKDGVIEKEFLIDEQNQKRDIILVIRALSAEESKKIAPIIKELGMETGLPVKVIVRDESALRNRIYGMAADGTIFIREDILSQGTPGQIKEAIDHERRELTVAEHNVIRAEQDQGDLRSLLTQLSDKDKAEPVGGIDMNDINVKRQGNGIDIQFDPAMMQDIINNGVDGFVPVIINLTPINSILPILGQKEPRDREREYPEVSSLN